MRERKLNRREREREMMSVKRNMDYMDIKNEWWYVEDCIVDRLSKF